MEPTPSPTPRKRVSDAERAQTAARLGEAFAEGRLGLDEFDRRNSGAHEAVFDDELRELVADLPEAGQGTAVAVRPEAGLAEAEQDEVVELSTDSASLRRRGEWVVPRRLRVSSRAGRVRLDMTEAVVPHPVVEIELSVYAGSTVLVLPQGATANLDGLRTFHARVRSKVPAAPRPGAVHIVLRGETYTGAVRVRYPRGG
ncbi:DUF1707 domain-containing protein [Streptomonospora sediminis]